MDLNLREKAITQIVISQTIQPDNINEYQEKSEHNTIIYFQCASHAGVPSLDGFFKHVYPQPPNHTSFTLIVNCFFLIDCVVKIFITKKYIQFITFFVKCCQQGSGFALPLNPQPTFFSQKSIKYIV